MHTFQNIKTNEEINIPSDIDELDPDQYLKYIELIDTAETICMPIHELRLHILKIVCPVSLGFRYLIMSKDSRSDTETRLYQLSEKMDSFFDIEETGNKKTYMAHKRCGTNLLPTWNGLRGPEDMLNNITWGDFVSCMNLLNAYRKAFEDEELEEAKRIVTELFHILYTGTSDKKMVVPVSVEMHALTFFCYVFELISSVPIPIHGEEIDFRILFSGNGSTGKDSKMGWSGLVFSVAESGVFGRTEDVNKESFWPVLLYLYKCTFDNQNLKRK